MYRCGYIFVL